MADDIFISYARSSERQAELIEESLAAMGYTVWRDRELPLHRPYLAVIEERLRGAKAVVVLWSKDAAASDWVRAEADFARVAEKLVQVSIDASPPPMPFNQLQCGDLSGWSGDVDAEAWGKLLASLSHLTKARPARTPPVAAPGKPLVAVLPFDNLSGDPDLLYFSDGVSEEILLTVTQTTGLRVIGRSSSFQFRGSDKAARNVSGTLGCTHVLDGSVRRSGNRVRISASLIECAEETALWSDRFDRDLSDVFALQDEIAEAVARALKSTFAPSATVGPVDPEAFDLYLRARAASPGGLGAFDADMLRQAVRKAPGFASAWAALAITRASHARFVDDLEVAAARAEAKEAADKALALDPASGTALVALALLEPVCGHFAECEAFLERALAVSPDDPVVLERYSRWLHGVGRSREALELIARAFEIDPLYHQGANWYAAMLANHGRRAEAYIVWDRARERWPEFEILTVNPLHTAAAARDWERVDRLIAIAKESGLDGPTMRDAIEDARIIRGVRKPQGGDLYLRGLREELERTGSLSLNPLGGAVLSGLKEEVFAMIELASFDHLFRPGGRLSAKDYGLHTLFNRGNRLRDDIRFVGLCAKLGLCDYWVASGHWPDCAAAAPYDFRAEVMRLTQA